MKRLLLFALILFVLRAGAQTAGPVYADNFPGADINQKIANAFLSFHGTAAAPATGATVYLAAGKNYRATSTLVIPNMSSSPFIESPTLDCQGATITIDGPGDKVVILGENDYKSGAIRNCNLNVTDPKGAVLFYSRGDFLFERMRLDIAHPDGMQWINDTVHGGPGYFEENKVNDLQLHASHGGCAITWRQGPSIAGRRDVGSFFYNYFTEIHADLEDGGKLLCLREYPGGGDPHVGSFGSGFDIHVNANGRGNSIFDIDNGANITRGTVLLAGESPGNDFDVTVRGHGQFSNFGTSYATGFAHNYQAGAHQQEIEFTSGPQFMKNDLVDGIGISFTGTEPEAGHPGRMSKWFNIGSAQVTALARYDGCAGGANGLWQVGWRQTTNEFPEVELAGASGNPFTNSLYADSCGGVGAGPGFGKAGGVRPQFSLHVTNSLGTSPFPNNLTPMGDERFSTNWERGGNLVDHYRLRTAAGQPSAHRTEMWEATDAAGATEVPGRDCQETAGRVNCSQNGTLSALGFHAPLRTPTSSHEACSPGDTADDANFHYVCTAVNTWKRVALSSF